ncbi:hypothetical protein [Sandarakinorhabdus sp.]|uniref:hypothetical protein n=1 Tax=Sandarakinorhabdus sp. TaxID=1916663 RepID=UPI0028A63BEE|nr:hypothetical protein [Sandarakinorhabdus sp.]
MGAAPGQQQGGSQANAVCAAGYQGNPSGKVAGLCLVCHGYSFGAENLDWARIIYRNPWLPMAGCQHNA